MLKILFDFSKLSDANLEGRTQQIHGNMDGSVYFPTPDPTLAALLAALTAFSAAVTAATDGGRLAAAIKNEKREELLNLLELLSILCAVLRKRKQGNCFKFGL
jgi:hypothetical protein